MTRPRWGSTLGNRLAWARAEAGWSQSDLADAMGASRGRVGHWETDFRRLSIKDAEAAAVAMGVDFEWLVLGKGRPEPSFRHHPALLRACIQVVQAWWRQHPEAAASADASNLVTDLYAKAAGAGLDRSVASESALLAKVQDMATFAIQIQ